ncbi:MAG: DUF2145 domain-containing protein [Alphaproteobacteria bacterium]|nr:DUF2145 domain-containing protein [Alphaproteobacteria bacterium]
MNPKAGILALGLCMTIGISHHAAAGQSCAAHDITVGELQSALHVATKVRTVLAQDKSEFALIARVGSDISAHGLEFTHFGFAQKRDRDGEWVVVHQLNPCASAESGLFLQGLGTFMLDDLLTHDVLVVTLSEAISRQLEQVFAENGPHKFYDPQYNMISYPGTPVKYQNSNEWLLELLAKAQAGAEGVAIETRTDAHRFYIERGFRGSIIRISPLRRAVASRVSKNIRFDDHPETSHSSGRYEVVSVKSIVDYLQVTGDASKIRRIQGSYRRADRRPNDPSNDETASD